MLDLLDSLNFKKWLEDAGEVLTTYSNTNDIAFERSGIRSKYTAGRKKPLPDPLKTCDPDRIFKKKPINRLKDLYNIS